MLGGNIVVVLKAFWILGQITMIYNVFILGGHHDLPIFLVENMVLGVAFLVHILGRSYLKNQGSMDTRYLLSLCTKIVWKLV